MPPTPPDPRPPTHDPPSLGGGSLLDRFREHIHREALFPEPGGAVLAVSGGSDSVAMLDLMCRVAPELAVTNVVVHVDHGILDESADVAEQVMGIAVRYEVRGYLASLGLGPGASETRARQQRYAALWEFVSRLGARYLVTGHHADDQIETVLYRVLRGTGPVGLAGMAARRRDGLVRPLLPFAKAELADWIGARCPAPGAGPPLHMDPSNADVVQDRAWIRHRLLPVIRGRYGADVDRRLLDVARHAADDRRAWGAVLRELPGLDFRSGPGFAELARDPMQGYDQKLCEAIVRVLAREAGCVLGPRRAARVWKGAARARSGSVFEVAQGWVVEVAFGRLRVLRLSDGAAGVADTPVGWGDEPSGSLRWGRWTLTWRPETAGQVTRGVGKRTTWVTRGKGTIRGPRPGDRIRPFGGIGRRRVSRLLMEGRIPRSERGTFPVFARHDEILWLPGVCRAESATPKTGESAIRLDASVIRHSEADRRPRDPRDRV